MDIPFFNEQVDLLFQIASWRTDWLDSIFRFLNYFDSEYFLMILIPFVWVGLSCRWGIRLAFLLIINSLVNFHLKNLFDYPRPIVAFPDLAMFPFDSPGFPSGAAQQVVLLSGILIAVWKSRWSWLVAAVSILLISFSRLYLGVHYPMDILGGWIVGLILLFAFLYGIPYIEQAFVKQGRSFGLVLCALVCFTYIYLLQIPSIYRLMGAWMGFGIGAYLAIQIKLYSPPSKKIQLRIYRGIAAVLSLFAIYALIYHQAIPFVQAFVAAFWISFGALPFCRFVLPEHARKYRY